MVVWSPAWGGGKGSQGHVTWGGYLGPVQKVDHAKHRPLPLLTGTLELPLILGSVKLSVQTKSHWQ